MKQGLVLVALALQNVLNGIFIKALLHETTKTLLYTPGQLYLPRKSYLSYTHY
jgi:hypothetical protein